MTRQKHLIRYSQVLIRFLTLCKFECHYSGFMIACLPLCTYTCSINPPPYPPSQMLQKLLASKNPDDLRAANRLIRQMVKKDDKRMQRLQKRLEELELIQNNIKLLSELLSHYNSQSGEHEKALIKVHGQRHSSYQMSS